LDDLRIADFVAVFDPINRLGDASPGFVWRHQTADGNSTSVRVRGDPLILINFSVWESIESMFECTYRSAHADIFRRRREFFEASELPQLVLWWIPAGHEPSSKRLRSGSITCASMGRAPTPSDSRAVFRPRQASRSYCLADQRIAGGSLPLVHWR
jgi:hypothetical protein